MNISKVKTLIPAPEDGEDGKTAASGMFIPAIIWVEADENGRSVGDQSFNVTASVMVDGISCGFEAPLTILSRPTAVKAKYDDTLGIIIISIADSSDPVEYEGEVKVSMEALVNGKIYPVTKGIPIVANRQGKDGEDGVTYEIVPSVSSIRADANGNILTGIITVTAYRIKGKIRTSCGVGGLPAIGIDSYWVQYRINGGSWIDCSNLAVGDGIYMRMAYGVPGSEVSSITSGIAFRLCYGTSASYSIVHEMADIQVVRDGQTGERGKTGRYYYYDGYFDSAKEYTATDNQAPYVAFDWEDTVSVNGVDTKVTKTSYYMLIAETNKKDGTYIAPRPKTEEATRVWELMETSFKWLIAEAIFINFAKLGAAIFSGDWMISQHGTIDGVASTDYTKFDADDPEGNNAGNFRPNYAVDLLTGEAWLNSAHIRGIVKVSALYTVEGSVKTVSGKYLIDLEDSPGNSYVLPGNSTVYLPDPTKYAGLSLTILFSANSVLAFEDGMYMAYYTGTTAVIQNGMSFKAVHSAEGLSVLTLQSIKAYGTNSGVTWVVVGQRGILGIRNNVDGPDNYQVLPDGRLLINS